MKEINEPFTVPRFTLRDHMKQPEIDDIYERERERQKQMAVVKNGWYDTDNWGEFAVAYDREKGRAYYK